MFEVYTGTRAGRPTVLLLLTAAALLGALGLAWTQVRGALALGEEVAIAGTPLIVRPPKGWQQDPRNPHVFGKWVRKRVWGREVWAAERKLEFHYNDYLVQFTRLFQAAATSVPHPARIGAWEGVQFLLEQHGSRSGIQTVYRTVSTPRGAQISIEYTPLAQVSHGDLDLVDVVCAAVRGAGTDASRTPQDMLAYVGVSFPIAPDWQVVGPDQRNGPGLWIQETEQDCPVWALALFRRDLRHRGVPIGMLDVDSLVVDSLVAESRLLMPRFLRPQGRSREDGVYIAFAQSLDRARTSSVVVSVWVVAKSPREAAVIYVLADPRHAEAANNAAEELATTLKFAAEFPR
jgi:hypothetical protein